MTVFPYVKAAVVLAHADIFSKRSACLFYDVASGTFDRWRNRLKSDEKLRKMHQQEYQTAKDEWQEETSHTLKLGLLSLQKAFKNDIFEFNPKNARDREAWAKGVDSMAKAIRSVGDLAISTIVLNDDEDDED